jgi:arylsulfatase A-like enzyme
LGSYGHTQVKTPHLDRLAMQGTLFTQFYVNGSVCSPSRTAFMTSHFPARHAMHGHLDTPEQNQARGMPSWIDPAVPTVTRLLSEAGYTTAHFGKWHLGSGPGAPDLGAYGIDDYGMMDANGRAWDASSPFFRAQSTAALMDETIRFIRSHRDKPFYVNVWTLVPHAILNPTEEQMQPYKRLSPGGPKFPHKSAAQIYYASVTDLDTQVGSAGPFRGRKRSLYEGGVRVPGIIRWPGKVPAGRVDDQSVFSGVDWLPTVCKLAGVSLPPDLKPDGEDMSDVLWGHPRPCVNPRAAGLDIGSVEIWA